MTTAYGNRLLGVRRRWRIINYEFKISHVWKITRQQRLSIISHPYVELAKWFCALTYIVQQTPDEKCAFMRGDGEKNWSEFLMTFMLTPFPHFIFLRLLSFSLFLRQTIWKIKINKREKSFIENAININFYILGKLHAGRVQLWTFAFSASVYQQQKSQSNSFSLSVSKINVLICMRTFITCIFFLCLKFWNLFSIVSSYKHWRER